MTTEVELKYLVEDVNVSEKIFGLLKQEQLSFNHQVKQLSNCYYDTAELNLRQFDMGLRVRTSGEHIEQTIKTAGIVVGGLHQRPEYNVELDSPFPQLALFPNEIWPENCHLDSLQNQLIPLFNTDFQRQQWQVQFGDSLVEIAFDQGAIASNGQQLNICEVELELIKGERSALFTMAKLLFKGLLLRAGVNSKAARGYRLFAGTIEHQPSLVQLDIASDKRHTSQFFLAGINQSLQQIQTMIEDYLDSQALTKLAELVDVLSLLRHGFWLFEDVLSENSQMLRHELSHFIQLFAWVDNAIYLKELMNKTGNYRKKLDYSKQLVEQLKLEKQRIPDFDMTSELLRSERFNVLQLNLLNCVLDGEASDLFVERASSDDLFVFAKAKLSENLSLLSDAVSSIDAVDAEQYLSQRKLLHRSLLTGNWFGRLFDQKERMKFRTPWLDMQQGLRELQSLWIIQQQLEKIDVFSEQDSAKIVQWQQRKVENLLLALSQTKDAALSMPIYWQY